MTVTAYAAPLMYVTAEHYQRRGEHVWLLTGRCPWCSKKHTHGGGDPRTEPATSRLGHRAAHCSPAVAGSEQGYRLVLAAVGVRRPRRRTVRW